MLLLSGFRPLRIARGVKRADIALLTNIKLERLTDIDLRAVEPWFDEALAIARTLNVSVHDLLTVEDMKTFDDDRRFYAVDLKFWGEGVRLPLSIALRLQSRFGLPMVEDLDQSLLVRQLWSMLESNERHPEAPGWCPWCRADIFGGAAHAATCLPHNLLGARALLQGRVQPGTADAPLPGRKGVRVGSAKVPGLKALRERLGLTQAEIARMIEFNPNHYARVERCELPLVIPKADTLCRLFNVSRDSLFTAPDPVALDDNSVPPAPPPPALVE